MKKELILLYLICLFISCNSPEEISKDIPTSDEIEQMDPISNSSLINNPITADDAISVENAAKIEFDSLSVTA